MEKEIRKVKITMDGIKQDVKYAPIYMSPILKYNIALLILIIVLTTILFATDFWKN